MVFLISYDLKVDNGNNARVRDVISNLGEAHQCLESSWLLDAGLSSGQVYKAIAAALMPGDTIFITPVRYDDCAGRTSSEKHVWEWLLAHPQ